MERPPSDDRDLVVFIIAKYDFYFLAVENVLQEKGIKVRYFREFSDIDITLINSNERQIFFFPHISELIPNDFLDSHTCIGFHTGDLPDDRGGSPVQHKIINQQYKTKVSSIKLTEILDGGPIYCQREIDLSHGNIQEMLLRIAELIASMVVEIILNAPIPQDQSRVSSPKKRLQSSNSNLELGQLSNQQIYDHIRMLDGLDYPKATFIIGQNKFILSNAVLVQGRLSFKCELEGR
jgi:methionyl-tRNA formyltransferase